LPPEKLIGAKMRNRILKLGIILTSVLAMSACSGSWEEDGIGGTQARAPVQTQASEVRSAPKTAGQIQLFPGGNAGQSFTVIQDINVAVNKTTAFNANPTVAEYRSTAESFSRRIGWGCGHQCCHFRSEGSHIELGRTDRFRHSRKLLTALAILWCPVAETSNKLLDT
jgi:hypothetical protein